MDNRPSKREENVPVFRSELSGLSASPSNDSMSSLDSSDGDDLFAAFTETGFQALSDDMSQLSEILSESFNSSDWLIERSNAKSVASDDIKSLSNNMTSFKTSLKKEAGYLAGRLHWNCRTRVSYDPRPISKRSRKRSIPEEMKDDTYWKKRCQNTARARKSREVRRLKEIEVLEKVKKLELEKLELQQEIDKLKEQLALLNERLTKRKQGVSLFDN